MRQFWNGLAGVVTKHHKMVLALAGVVTIIMAFGITTLEFETSQDGLIGADNPVAQDNERFQEDFGGEPMLVLFSAKDGSDKQAIDLISDPANAETLAEFDQELRDTGLFHAVVSPLTAMTFAASQVGPGTEIFGSAEEYAPKLVADEMDGGGATAAEAEASAVEVEDAVKTLQEGTTTRITSTDEFATAAGLSAITEPVAHTDGAIKALSDTALAEALLYESDAEDPSVVATDDEGNPVIRPILRANFPKIDQGLMIIATQGNIDIADMGEAADKVVEIAEKYENSFEGFELTVGGPPQLLQDVNDYLQTGLATLGGLSFLVMAIVLYFVFRVRWRLLSLTIVVIGAIWGFGLMGYLGIPLTLITIAALPILIGVGVDFSIQTHSRMEEEVNEDGNAPEGMRRLMRWLAPPLAVAAISAVVGFLALNISKVPMIGDFGVMLALGILALFIAGLLVPTSILAWREKVTPTKAGEARIPHGFLERVVRGMMFSMQKFVLPMAVVGVLIIILGLSFEGRFVIETDAEKWLPQEKNSVQCELQKLLGGDPCTDTVADLKILQERAGFSSVLALLIEADDVTSDEVSSWAQQFTNQQMEKHGPDGDGTLKDVNSLYGVAFDITKTPPNQESMNLLIGDGFNDPPAYTVAPEDVLLSTVAEDRKAAALQFPIAPISLKEREALVDEINEDLAESFGTVDIDVSIAGFPEIGGPPDESPNETGVSQAGIAAVGVELVKALEDNRQLITFAGLGAVALWLLIFYRRIWKVVLVLIPVLIAVGLSSVVTFVTGITLSPMTSVSAPLVIATCTEFVVLILARYWEERERGRTPEEAIDVGGVRIGRAFVASGLTTVGGFIVLAVSPFPLVWQFGVLVALNVLVALTRGAGGASTAAHVGRPQPANQVVLPRRAPGAPGGIAPTLCHGSDLEKVRRRGPGDPDRVDDLARDDRRC